MHMHTPKKKKLQKKNWPLKFKYQTKSAKIHMNLMTIKMLEQHLPASADFLGTSTFQSSEIGIASS